MFGSEWRTDQGDLRAAGEFGVTLEKDVGARVRQEKSAPRSRSPCCK